MRVIPNPQRVQSSYIVECRVATLGPNIETLHSTIEVLRTLSDPRPTHPCSARMSRILLTLKGSGDLVSRVISNKVTIVISTYSLDSGTYNPTH